MWVADVTGAGAYRYTPDRSNKTAHLGDGFFTRFTALGKNAGAAGNGVGVVADSRSQQTY